MLKRSDGYYERNGKKFVSVTTFLKIINKEQLNAWRAKIGTVESTRIASEAADVGGLFHEAVEYYIGKRPYVIKNDSVELMFNKFLEWWEEKIPQEERDKAKPERIVFSESYGYAGQLDCSTNKRILDWKTSKRIYEDYILQCHAYSYAEAEMAVRREFPFLGTAEVSLILHTDAEWKPKPIQIVRVDKVAPFKMQIKPRKEPMEFDWDLFEVTMSALKLWRWQNEKKVEEDGTE